MKHKSGLILASLAMVFSCGLISQTKKASNVEEADALYTPSTHYEVSDTTAEFESYYSSAENKTGDDLLSALRSINSSKYHKQFSYSNFGTSSTTSPYVYTDYPLGTTTTDSNGQVRGSAIASFYTKTTATGYNKEHVWPNSKGGSKVENDILMPRPTIESENSSRGNSNFIEGQNSQNSGWDPFTAGFDKECRGECARIMLYCVVASSQLSLSTGTNSSSSSCGDMNTLIKWHFDYAPSVYEMNRNNGAEYLQGNRNPFVDHPEYVAKIWSNYNSTVSNYCSQNSTKYENWVPGYYCNYGENTPVNAAGISISKSSANILANTSTTLSATSTNGANISWTTSSSSIVSLSSASSASGASITITGVSAGSATITARATIDNEVYSKQCVVTVTSTKQVVSIAISGETTSYSVDDPFVKPTVTATYNDNTQATVTSEATCTGYNMSVAGEYTVTVSYSYGGKTETVDYSILVTASGSSGGISDYSISSSALTSSGITNGMKVIWGTTNSNCASNIGSNWVYLSSTSSDWIIFTLEGTSSGFTLRNDNGDYVYSTGEKKVAFSSNKTTFTLNSNGVPNSSAGYYVFNSTGLRPYASIGSYSKSYLYALTLNKTLSSISVSTAPTKTTYTAGECFDPTGLVITRNYSDSTSDTYTYANHTSDFGFTPSTSTALTTGNTSVTITYGGKSTSQAITVNAAKTLSSIAVSTAPTKTTYTAGEYFDPTGLVITRNYSDSTSDTYTYSGHTSDFTFSPSTSTALTTSNASVTITYGGKSCSQSITVNAAKTLSSIAVSTAPTKTSYYAGQTFDPTGLVIRRNYSDSTYDTYTYSGHTSEFTFSPSTSTALTTSDTSVTITYGGKSTTQSITVQSVTLSSITVSTAPTKTSYIVDECFDPTGLVITRNYSNSTSDTYTYAGHTSEFTFNPSTITPLTTENTSVTITYGGKTCSQPITVTTSGGGSTETDTETIVMSNQGYTSGAEVTSASGTACSVTFAKNGGSNAPKYYSSGTAVRLYPSNTMTVSSEQTIVRITITFGSGEGSNAISTDVQSYSNGEWTGSSNSVTFTIGGSNGHRRIASLEIEYETSGGTQDPTSITATLKDERTFYVGETITKSDITVKTNLNVDVTSSVSFENYQFTYSDASSGGALTYKQFNITYSNMQCTLIVQVQRKAYAVPSSGSITLTSSSVFNNIGGGNNSLKNGTVTSGGVVYEYYQSYYYSGGSSLSFGNASSQTGYLTNQTAFTYGISDVTVTSSGRAVNVRYSEDGSNWVLKSSATPASKTYQYFKIDCIGNTGSNYSNITVISITTKTAETANNVSNYIMYEDTNNQCTTKLSVAIGYLSNCSQAELTTFQTSTDYVISTGRERLEAWARNQGKSINYTAGNVTLGNQVLPTIEKISVNNTTMIIIIVSIVGVASIGGYFFLKKRKED